MIAAIPTPLLAGTIATLAAVRAAVTRTRRHMRFDRLCATNRCRTRQGLACRRITRPGYWIDRLDGDQDLDGVLFVESESFTNPWTRDMYAWELQNRAVCHIFVVRTADRPVVGFCAFWLVVDEIHINNVAILPDLRGQGIGTALMNRVFAEATASWRAPGDARGARVERGARRLYERLGFYAAGTRRHYYTNPVEDALILWRDC